MASDDTTTCILPGGYLDESGTCHREVELRSLSGQEEEFITVSHCAPAEMITRVLSRCVQRIGSVMPVTEAVVRTLLVADRQYLLLQMRAITFGEQVHGTLSCPWMGCGAKADVEFSISDVPVVDRSQVRSVYEIQLSQRASGTNTTDPEGRIVRFRLPNGADQEVAAPLLTDNAARAFTLLLERCIESPRDVCTSEFVAGLSPQARAEIETAMQEHAPAVELDMEVQCPECHRAFTAPFDVQDFFLGELRVSSDLLYRQVHYLAYHYHWSEREILKMPREKRQTYIQILAEEMEAAN